jgi:molybdopterin-guanine dinucleotide biosynthesis protein A
VSVLERSVVILAFETAKGFTEDKGVTQVEGKPLLRRVVDAVDGCTDETIIVTESQEQINIYQKLVPPDIEFVVCNDATKGPLAMALCGLEAAKGNYTLLLPSDNPFISSEVIDLLFDLSTNKAAVVPRSPDSEPEPLQSVYNTKKAIEVAKAAIAEGDYAIEALVEQLRCIRYLSTMVIEQLDPELKTFFRVKTPLDFKKAAVLSKPKPKKRQKTSYGRLKSKRG